MAPGAPHEEDERCSWCGGRLDLGDGYRLGEPAGARRAGFCRLEHVVPWAIQGARWEPGAWESAEDAPDTCSRCGAQLGEVRLVLVRHRGPHRIPDAFCSVDHLAEWARAGGRWR